MVTQEAIRDFFAVKRIVLIGASRRKDEYSRRLMSDLRQRGYEVIPVNPGADQIDGQRCHARVQDVPGPVERAIIVLPPDKSERAVLDCAAAGVHDVWLHNHIAAGVQNTRAIYQAEQHGIRLITGFCPFMFLPDTAFFHRLHGWILKLLGAFPKSTVVKS
jgi:predicted CoA-binding protein